MVNQHATDESLLLLANGKLSKGATSRIIRHLDQCPACQGRYEETRRVRTIWAQLSDEGRLRAAPPPPVAARPLSEPRTYRFPWLPIGGGAAACLIVLAILFLPSAITTAKASDLLDHAVSNQDQYGLAAAFSVDVNGVLCATGQRVEELIAQRVSGGCARATEQLSRSPWNKASPLSAKAYLGWHRSLTHRHDVVTKQNSAWTIRTTTTEGLVREANLTLRSGDYHPVSLDLRFDDNTQLSIHETAVTTMIAETNAAGDHHRAELPVHSDNPSDLLEVAAWEQLIKLNADSGWEANVLRDGSKVIVKASVADDARAQAFRSAFGSLPGVETEIHNYQDGLAKTDFLAQRTLNGDAPAQAHEWLVQHFSDSESRSKFTNDTVGLSKVVLGRSFIVSELRHRYQALQGCSCAAALSKLLAHEESLLNIAQTNLASTVAPLAGAAGRTSSRPITYDEARKIDTALEVLLAASSSQDPLSYGDNLALVRKLK